MELFNKTAQYSPVSSNLQYKLLDTLFVDDLMPKSTPSSS